jgi:hypothetical protein
MDGISKRFVESSNTRGYFYFNCYLNKKIKKWEWKIFQQYRKRWKMRWRMVSTRKKGLGCDVSGSNWVLIYFSIAGWRWTLGLYNIGKEIVLFQLNISERILTKDNVINDKKKPQLFSLKVIWLNTRQACTPCIVPMLMIKKKKQDRLDE